MNLASAALQPTSKTLYVLAEHGNRGGYQMEPCIEHAMLLSILPLASLLNSWTLISPPTPLPFSFSPPPNPLSILQNKISCCLGKKGVIKTLILGEEIVLQFNVGRVGGKWVDPWTLPDRLLSHVWIELLGFELQAFLIYNLNWSYFLAFTQYATVLVILSGHQF